MSQISYLKPVSWKAIAKQLEKLAPNLHQLIAQYPKLCEQGFYLARYAYGAYLLNDLGEFHLPDGMPLSQADNKLQQALGYNDNGLPLSLLLHNQCEAFIQQPNGSIHTVNLYRPGDWLGINDTLTSNPLRQTCVKLTAGSRSAFLLPPIRGKQGFKQLTHAFPNFKRPSPQSLQEHGPFFAELVNHPQFNNDWSVEVLLFPQAWADLLRDSQHSAFRSYLLSVNSQFNHKLIEDNLWSLLLDRYQYYKSYNYYDLINHAKTILQIGIGQLPGYCFATDDQAGPFTQLAQVFLETYEWRKRLYAPLFVIPSFIQWQPTATLYTSLNKQTLTEGPESALRVAIDYTEKLQLVIQAMLDNAKKYQDQLQATQLMQLTQLTLDFCKAEAEQSKNAFYQAFFAEDPAVIQWQQHNKVIACNNFFLRCCVKLNRSSAP